MSSHSARLLVRTTPPSAEPLDLSEAKLFLRVDETSEDTLITSLVIAARLAAEEYTRRSFVTQGWTLAVDDGVRECVTLPRGPVQSIGSVKAIARDGTEATLAAGLYYLNAAKDALMFDAPIFAHRVEIVYQAGYGAASDVPEALKQGMLMHIAALFEDREGEGPIPPGALSLYEPFREIRL